MVDRIGGKKFSGFFPPPGIDVIKQGPHDRRRGACRRWAFASLCLTFHSSFPAEDPQIRFLPKDGRPNYPQFPTST